MAEINIGFLVFPDLFQLDLTGAYGVLGAGPNAKMHLLWKDLTPVRSSDGLLLTPTTTMPDCPQLDVICVPGGAGIRPLLEDDEVLAFLCNQAKNAAYVTSVCTGALVLGAAGLLRGYKATTHWSSIGLLEPFGAIHTARRVVTDGNRITAAGVTSGIDMALTLATKLWGENTAQTIALNMEYAPEPPFACGSPQTAPEKILKALTEKNSSLQHERTIAVNRAAQKLYGNK